MKMTAFNAVCPLEIGDKIIKVPGNPVAVYVRPTPQPRAVIMQQGAKTHVITDIAAVHYIRDRKIVFTYELDRSGRYQELDVKVI